MDRKVLLIFCLALLLTAALALEVSGESDEMCVPMGVITLEPPEGVEATKTSVDFPHSRHFATDCRSCHHTWQGEEPIQGCMAAGCHDQATAPKEQSKYLSYSDVAIKYYKYAYHQSCIGCHREIRARNLERAKSYMVLEEKLPEAGPSGCIECHPEY